MDVHPNVIETKAIKTEISDADEEFSLCNIKIERNESVTVNNIKNKDITVDHIDSGLEESLPMKTEFKLEDTSKYDFVEYKNCDMFGTFKNLKYEVKSEEMDISYSSMCLMNEDDIKASSCQDAVTAIECGSDECDKSNDDVKIKLRRKNNGSNSKRLRKWWQRKEVDQLTTAASKVSQSSYHCFHCDYSTNVRSYLVSHMLVHNKRQKELFSCTYCFYSTKYRQNLVQHTVKVHSDNYEKHSCTGCERHFMNKSSLDDHILKNHQDLIGYVSSKVHNCSTCGYRTTVKRDLRRHTINEHSANYEKHPCKGCEKNFTNKVALDDHILKYHQNLIDLVSSKIHTCPTCNFKTTSTGHFRRHTANVHSGNYERFSCTGCEKHFRNKISLDDHIIKHHKHLFDLVTHTVKNCPTCDYKTSNMSHLKRHIVNSHTGNYEKLTCGGCEKHFKNKMSLDDHILKNHPNLFDLVSRKVHNCPTCDYKTTFVSQLKHHTIKVHTGNYEKHSCTSCEKHFKDKRSLDDHIIKNHQSSVDLVSSKVHCCSTCGYKTARKSDLRRHMKRVHSD